MDAHPDLVQTLVRPIQVGYRYEVTPRSVYVLGAQISYYKSGSITTFPYTQLGTVSALNAVLSTNAAPGEQANADDLWFLTLGEGRPVDAVTFPDGRALYCPFGVYVAFSAAEDDAGDLQALLRVTYVNREDYCPARTSPTQFASACGAAPVPGPSTTEDAWAADGSAIAQYLEATGSLDIITTSGSDPIQVTTGIV